MVEIFGHILVLSYSGSITIWMILLLRKLLENTGKRYIYYLWALPWVKLAVPIGMLGVWDMVMEQPIVNPILSICNNPIEQSGRNIVRGCIQSLDYTLLQCLCIIWVLGVLVLAIRGIAAYIRLAKRLTVCVKLQDRVYLSDGAMEPFVFGILRPRIYLPSDTDPSQYRYIILHEEMHIKRRDYLIKILVGCITTLHWFNPIVWIGRYYMTEDMEMFCDESVTRSMSLHERKEYALTLLLASSNDDTIDLSVLSFGEDSVKMRILNIAARRNHSKITRILLNGLMVLLVIFMLPQYDPDDTSKRGREIDVITENVNGAVLMPVMARDDRY